MIHYGLVWWIKFTYSTLLYQEYRNVQDRSWSSMEAMAPFLYLVLLPSVEFSLPYLMIV